MRYTALFVAVALGCLGTGCGSPPAVSLRPLYSAGEKPAAEPRIEGEWTGLALRTSGVSDEAQWKINVAKDGCYEAERQKKDSENKPEKDEREIYRACLVRLDDKLLFDTELTQKKIGLDMINARDMEPGMVAVHVVGRIWAEQDFVRLAQLNAEWTKQNVPEELRDTSGRAVVFSGSTPQLRELMAQHASDTAAMPYAWYLCRPGVDCAQRIVEDELARGPDRSDMLQGAAEFYGQRGEYAKALALLQKRAALEPTDASLRQDVGLARLFVRDFAGAREDFTAAAKLEEKKEEKSEGSDILIALTYFLEGKYADTHKVLSRIQPSSDSAPAVLLDYVCLVRMGRGKQAETLLSERMAQLVAPEDQQLWLLRFTGRIKDYSPEFTDEELENGMADMYAIVRLAKGDREAGIKALQETMAKSSKNGLAYLGAQIELERLDASLPKKP